MAATLGPALSVIVRSAALKRCDESALAAMGPIVSRDADLTVFGPYCASDIPFGILKGCGLEYFDDYFDMAHDGGIAPEWCRIILEANVSD
jgi:hypothetical protein